MYESFPVQERIKAIQGTKFLILDLITLTNWRTISIYMYSPIASISLGNAPPCTSCRMVFSTLFSSSNLRHLCFMFAVHPTLPAPSLGGNAILSDFSFRRSIQAMDFFHMVSFGKACEPLQKVCILFNIHAVHNNLLNLRIIVGNVIQVTKKLIPFALR